MARAEEVFEVLRQVRFPGLDQDIVHLGYVKEVSPDGEQVLIRLEIATSDRQAFAQIETDVRSRLEAAGIPHRLEITNPHGGAEEKKASPGT